MVFRIRRSSHLEKVWMDSTFREYAATTTREISRAFAEGEMTQDEIIEMANEAGNGDEEWSIIAKQLFKHFPEETQRFAKLVAQHEREACAEFVDSVELPLVAMLIRARGQA